MAHLLAAAASILSILITVLLVRRAALPAIPGILTAFAFLLIIAGGGMVYYHEHAIENALLRKFWPTTEGVVVKSEVAGIRAFHPEVTCSYSVKGQSYRLTTNLGTPGFGNKRSRRDTAGRILRDYPEGKKVTVHYDPADPARAFLRVGPAWHTFMKLGLGIMILMAGITGFTGSLLRRVIKPIQ